jgi:prepilin-type N-terminal cleavage/methylation domain-containing protein
MSRHRRTRRAGFTFIEALIVLTVLGICVIGVVPSLLSMLARARMTSAAQTLSSLMYQARMEAIKRGVQGTGVAPTPGINGRVELDFAARKAISYIDLDQDEALSAADVKLGELMLGKNLEFHGPGPGATPNVAAIWNFDLLPTGGAAIFKSDGSVVKSGAFRIRDERGNILEVRVEPQATARVSVQKFTGDAEGADAPTDPAAWIRQDQGWSWN